MLSNGVETIIMRMYISVNGKINLNSCTNIPDSGNLLSSSEMVHEANDDLQRLIFVD